MYNLKYSTNIFVKFSLLLITVVLVMSFKSNDPCLNEVRAVFEKMNQAPQNGKIVYVPYSVKAVLNEKDKEEKNIESASDIEMFSSNKHSWILSKQMNVYKDGEYTMTVLPDRKQIYLTDAVVEKDDNMFSKLKQLQDTLFNNCEKVLCVDAQGVGYDKTIILFLNSKFSQFLEMKKVVYYINSSEKILHRVYVEYAPEKQYKSIDYVFGTADYDYKKTNISASVEQLLYVGKTVKQEYKGYQIIDNRKKSYKK